MVVITPFCVIVQPILPVYDKLTHRVGVLDEETQKKADKAYAVNGGIA